MVVFPALGELVTNEWGRAQRIGVRLRSQPNSEVRIGVNVSALAKDEAQGPAEPFVFTRENWRTMQYTDIVGLDDQSRDRDVEYTVYLSYSSQDPDYKDLKDRELHLVNRDNECPHTSRFRMVGDSEYRDEHFVCG